MTTTPEEEWEDVKDLPMGCIYAGFILICLTIIVLLIGMIRFDLSPSPHTVPADTTRTTEVHK